MPYFIRVRPKAEAHLQEAYSWYAERSPRASQDFLTALDAAFSALSDFPMASPIIYQEVRRILLRKFPYAIYYLFEEQEVRVLGLLHVRRHPGEARRLT